jgi:AcrR family transcriptional regulator
MTPSKLATSRKHGDHQVDAQRTSILDAAQALFLRQGLENTTMQEIAVQAGITKVTLYRYFPNRDLIALAIWERMSQHLWTVLGPRDGLLSLEGARDMVRTMITNFDTLRDTYRYFGMFDGLYLDHAPESAVAQRAKRESSVTAWQEILSATRAGMNPDGRRSVVVLSAAIWFLEKVALRGEVTWFDLGIPLEEQLAIFEQMVMRYIERLLSER